MMLFPIVFAIVIAPAELAGLDHRSLGLLDGATLGIDL